MEVLREAEPQASDLERADGLLERLLVGLADAHHFADRAHLRTKLVDGPGELLERPAGELDHHVVAARGVLVERAVAPVGDLVQGQPGRQQRTHHRDREAGGLAGQRGRPGRPGVDFDHHEPVGCGVVTELNVGAADHPDPVDDPVRRVLQAFLDAGRHGQHRRGAVGVAGVHAHRVDVLDEADGDHRPLGVAYDLEFEFLPAEHRLLDQHLVDHGRRQPPSADGPQFFDVVDQAAPGAAHRVGGAQHHRVAELAGHLLGLGDRGDGAAARHLDAQFVHSGFELLTVLATADGVLLDADGLHPVFVEHAGFGQLAGQVEPGLAAEVGQQRVRPGTGDDLGEAGHVERGDEGLVGHHRVGHDRRRVRVDQDDLVAEPAQRLAGLGAGVVELAGLPDHDGARTDDQDPVDVIAFRHGDSFVLASMQDSTASAVVVAILPSRTGPARGPAAAFRAQRPLRPS